MFASTLLSLSASVLITAGTFVSTVTAGYTGQSAPALPSHTLDGLPVTNLPGIMVYPPNTDSSARARPHHVSVLDQLADSASTQVANSHLGMPYYSFGSGYGLNGKD